jgi:hypothetical protein
LFDLSHDGPEIKFGLEKVGHFQEEKSRKSGSDEAVVNGISERSTV